MTTRNRLVLAGVAMFVIAFAGMALHRSETCKRTELENRMAVQDVAIVATNNALEKERTRLTELRDAYDVSVASAKLHIDELNAAITKAKQSAEAELQANAKESEQRLAGLRAELAADKAKMDALEASQKSAEAEIAAFKSANPDLASFRQEYNGIVKIYEYSSFEFDGIKSMTFVPGEGLKIERGKFKFEGRSGHLTGFVQEQKKTDDKDYQYLWSAGHLKGRDTSRPIKEIWGTFRDDLALPPEKLELVGYDWLKDLSLLRFRKGFKFPGKAFKLGDVASVRPGDKVVAMGCPLDVQFAATEGEVMDQEYVGRAQGFTQTRLFIHSAPITFGNSGGPLILKRTGEVIAVNVMLVNVAGGYFLSTMVDDMKAMYPRLKEAHGREVIHAALEHAAFENSWRMNPPDWELIGVKAPKERCVVCTEVQKDSTAAKSGLMAGDVVLEWNGVAPRDDAHLWQMITDVIPSALGTMKVRRGDEVKELHLPLVAFDGEVFVHEWNKVEEVTPPKQ